MTKSKVVLAEDVAGERLRAAGIPVVASQSVPTVDAFEHGVNGVSYPVVLKACGEGLLHKTEHQAVVLDIPDRAGLTEAQTRILERLPWRPERFLIQPMARPGLDLIVGAHRDPVFGPVVLVGMGGVQAEALRDTALGTTPMDLERAMALIRSLRAWPLLDGYRGGPPLDARSVADCLCRLAALMEREPEVASVDINPLRVYPEGCLALDAAMVLETPVERSARDMRSVSPAQPAPPLSSAAGRWSARSGLDLLRGAAENLTPLFNPRSIAVVGAARTSGKAGRVIFENLLRAGFPGPVHPVNPAIDRLLGHRCHALVSNIPDRVDLAVIAVPRVQVPAALSDAAAAGVKAAIVTSGGFSDAGPEGREAEAALRDQAARLGIRLLGPNSIGIIDPARGINTSITTLEPLQASPIALVGQTGLFAAGFAAMFHDHPPFGIGRVVCLGNRADIDEAHVLEDLAGDDRIRAVGLYLEGVRDGSRFRQAVSRLVVRKPLVVVKGGRSRVGGAAVASHTGSLAGSDEVFSAVLRELGVVQAEGFGELFDLLQAMASGPRPRGRRLGVVSVSGAGCVLAADAAERAGLSLPALSPETLAAVREVVPDWAPARNPLDLWAGIERWGAAEAYRRCTAALLAQPDVDQVLLAFVMIPEAEFDPAEVLGDLRTRYPDKPLYAVLFGGTAEAVERWRRGCHAVGVPTYPDIAHAVSVIGKLSPGVDG